MTELNTGLDASESMTEQHLFDPGITPPKVSLAARFTLPPFTYLDGRSGWWQDRKSQWKDMGLVSGDGRTARTFAKGSSRPISERTDGFADAMRTKADKKPGKEMDETTRKILAVSDGQSIFDPVLCEMLYRWFCPRDGTVLDPFAGGSVRGLVAATLGRRYHGIDLAPAQIEANRTQDEKWCGNYYPEHLRPTWYEGDADTVLVLGHTDAQAEYQELPQEAVDFVMSCPPYHDLEVYSDHPADLSAMPWQAFVEAYRSIIASAVNYLAPDRFAAWVIGEIRGPDGCYRNLVGETVRAFTDAGASYYNEAFLVSPAGTLPLRTAKMFVTSRKMGRTHQTVLVFVKGDPKRAAEACDPDAMRGVIGDAEADDLDEDLSGMGHG